ncbi:MAG: phage tail tube protein [Hyphomicrobiales bacterium]
MSVDSIALRSKAQGTTALPVPGEVGRDILMSCDHSGQGDYRILAGLRSPYLVLGRRRYDLKAPRPCKVLSGSIKTAAGRTLLIGGEGVFRNEEARARIAGALEQGSRWRWRLRIPETGTLEGPFCVRALRAADRGQGICLFELGSTGRLSFRAS